MKRRFFLGGGAVAAGAIASFAAWQKRAAIYDILPGAHTSRDSRWYPFTTALAARLSDLSPRGWQGRSAADINNRHLLDLSDLEHIGQLSLVESNTVIQRSEAWEISQENPAASGPDADVGYPTLAAAQHGGPAGAYHLFYAIHDPRSGIGVAIADRPEGPYIKLASIKGHGDSQILRAPYMPRNTSHFSSPAVVWNEEKSLWHLYFHFYENRFIEGNGHQRTALATSTDLIDWQILLGQDGKYLAVLPTTHERWMNSQFSYHAIQRLPNGLWLAWLRGTGGEMRGGDFQQDVTALGLAVSEDGVRWSMVPGSPQWRAGTAQVSGKGVVRPGFMALLKSGLHCCWSESDPIDVRRRYVIASTSDFKTFMRKENPLAHITVGDGAVSAWREKDEVFLFTGSKVHRMRIKYAT